MNKRGHVLNAVVLGVGLGVLLEPTGDERMLATIVMITVPVTLGAMVPDIDTEFGRHRKTLHNLPLLVGFVAFPYFFANLEYVWIGVLTHYVLDVAGSRRGIALFYPLSSAEYGLPVGVPVSSSRTDLVTILITALELALAGLIIYEVPQWGFEMGRQAAGF